MTAGDFGSIASAAIALVALIVSFVSMRKTDKFGATTDELNRKLLERENEKDVQVRKAEISANIVEVGKHNHRLKVFNKGAGTARNVRLTDLQEEDSVLIAGDIERSFPVPMLEQHQSVELIAVVHSDTGPRTHIKLQWDDDTGRDHQKEMTLTL